MNHARYISLCLCFLFFMNATCQAQENYDVETLPTLRTQQYAAGTYKSIIIFASSRTGSSLVYNVFRFLFEDDSKLSAPHNIFDLNCRVLRTHRIPELETVKKKRCSLYFYIPQSFRCLYIHLSHLYSHNH